MGAIRLGEGLGTKTTSRAQLTVWLVVGRVGAGFRRNWLWGS